MKPQTTYRVAGHSLFPPFAGTLVEMDVSPTWTFSVMQDTRAVFSTNYKNSFGSVRSVVRDTEGVYRRERSTIGY